MNTHSNRRKFLASVTAFVVSLSLPVFGQISGGGGRKKNGGGGRKNHPGALDYVLPPELAQFSWLSLVLGRVTEESVTVSAIAKENIEGYIEYGTASGSYSSKSAMLAFPAAKPVEVALDQLPPNTQYFYRLQFRKAGATDFTPRPECRFHTQRAAGRAFTFAIQGDSPPERPQMSEPNLYARTLLKAAADRPDFYICMGMILASHRFAKFPLMPSRNATRFNDRFLA